MLQKKLMPQIAQIFTDLPWRQTGYFSFIQYNKINSTTTTFREINSKNNIYFYHKTRI